MTNLKLPDFLRKHSACLALFLILYCAVFFSLPALVTKPRLWADEAKTIELAKNFLKFGKLDIETAPGEFSGYQHLLQSTGYPLTVPLAGFFKIFGFG